MLHDYCALLASKPGVTLHSPLDKRTHINSHTHTTGIMTGNTHTYVVNVQWRPLRTAPKLSQF